MNSKFTTLAEYRLHKNKLNRDSYAKRKALLNKSIESKKDYVYKPRKEKVEGEAKAEKTKKKKTIVMLITIIHSMLKFQSLLQY